MSYRVHSVSLQEAGAKNPSLREQGEETLEPQNVATRESLTSPVPINAFTVDVEDYFHVRAFSNVIAKDEWERREARVESNTEDLLDLLAARGVQGTFFVLGWVAERHPNMVRRIRSEGHEIASHGYHHDIIIDQSREAFREDIKKSKALLEDLSGETVRGYRAPTFSINEKTWWAYEILEEEGYGYSSSLYPISHDLYGMPHASRRAFCPTGGDFWEFPLSTARLFGRNFPAAGGGYFRFLPYSASSWLIRRINQVENAPCVFYCHPWEIDPHQPRIEGLSAKSRFRHYVNLHATHGRLDRILKYHSWGRMDDVFLKAALASKRTSPG